MIFGLICTALFLMLAYAVDKARDLNTQKDVT